MAISVYFRAIDLWLWGTPLLRELIDHAGPVACGGRWGGGTGMDVF